MKKLAEEKVICGYHTVINWDKTNQDHVMALIEVNASPERDCGYDKAVSYTHLLLEDPLQVDQFVEDYQDQTGDYVILNANNETFKKLARPLDTLSLFSNIIVWIVAINAIVIITLVTALTLKIREYEIGVLLSIGVSKMKIVAQFFVELIIVALIGFTLSVAVSYTHLRYL